MKSYNENRFSYNETINLAMKVRNEKRNPDNENSRNEISHWSDKSGVI